MDINNIKTLKDLKKAKWASKSVKEELRGNLIKALKNKEDIFAGLIGYDETVIPDVQRAVLSKHNIILLGLRGQAKTRLARQMIDLLDEYIPYISGSEIHDDPMNPISKFGKDKIADLGDDVEISWLHRSERYVEKLATPDVSVADLIGDVDPIKAATLKLPYSDERVIHFGLVPRSHRCLFVINELPDLQARIQVALFNILQEGDIQIRGFNMRMPLDIQFVFTANPEDYTNRGSIVTPLKDRIESQILTHYAPNIELSRQITEQEARVEETIKGNIDINDVARDLIEEIAFQARESEFVDAKSGVSQRMTITALENLFSSIERRLLINGEKQGFVRIGDFWGVIPAITGKVELVYEGEQEGPFMVAQNLIGKAIRKQFVNYFPDMELFKKKPEDSPYLKITDWFSQGNSFEIKNDLKNKEYIDLLMSIPGLAKLVEKYQPKSSKNDQLFMMEFVLHALAEFSQLSKSWVHSGYEFGDLFSSMFSLGEDDEGGYYES